MKCILIGSLYIAKKGVSFRGGRGMTPSVPDCTELEYDTTHKYERRESSSI
uniref:Uncharacterized protein n=1 Tax=Anguilla anguilla TaxID=7936 RepID=A0A0E9SBX9_ANGAN